MFTQSSRNRPTRLQTFPGVTHPCFTEITYCPDQSHPSCMFSRMGNDTIRSHALCSPTFRTHGDRLNRLAEVTEGTVLLPETQMIL